MWQFVLSSWRSGLRSKTFLGVFILGVALVGVAFLSASFSPRQPQTVALDVGLSGLRFSLVLFAIVLVQELVGREIDRRAVILTLSYPVPRSAYLMGRYLGVLGLTATAALLLGLLLWLAVLLAGLGYTQQFGVELGGPYWFAVFGVWLDVAVVSAFAFWIASLSTVALLPLALGAIFAIAGKALGPVTDYLAKGGGSQDELVATFGPMLDVIRWLLPDLSRLDWRVWPMYGSVPEMLSVGLTLVMSLAYIALMIGLSIRFFAKREFS